jgi:hypothetical protein
MKLTMVAEALLLCACHQQPQALESLHARIDSLSEKVDHAYKPGFGEFMSSIQAHHAKLWFAGQNENWKLADFEIHEIMEAVEDIQTYQTEREESKLMGMLTAPLDSLNRAIEQKDIKEFRNTYSSLTNTCNACHRATNFDFNIVKIPDSQLFSNQDFSPPK